MPAPISLAVPLANASEMMLLAINVVPEVTEATAIPDTPKVLPPRILPIVFFVIVAPVTSLPVVVVVVVLVFVLVLPPLAAAASAS